MAVSNVHWRILFIPALLLALSGGASAQEGEALTMKIGNTCGAKYNELYVQIQDGPRARVKPNLTVTLPVKPGTKVRVKQRDDSVSMKVDGIWTEAEPDGELLTRCLR